MMPFLRLHKGRLVGLAGAGFLLLAAWLLSNQFLFLYRARRASATVVELYTHPGYQERNAAVYPVLHFTTPQG